jgi:hypothetical protein
MGGEIDIFCQNVYNHQLASNIHLYTKQQNIKQKT